MRDHLDARKIKTPSEMALHADMFWDAHRAQRADSIPTAAATCYMLKTLECIHERGDISPAHHNQTPGPAGPGECYFYKPFGSLAISRKLWIQGNSRASERRMN